MPGVGLDCIGLVIHAVRMGGVAVNDQCDYGRLPQEGALEQALLDHRFIRKSTMNAADVLLFRFPLMPQHVGLMTGEGTLVHAYAPQGAVVETVLNANWLRRLYAVYGLEGC